MQSGKQTHNCCQSHLQRLRHVHGRGRFYSALRILPGRRWGPFQIDLTEAMIPILVAGDVRVPFRNPKAAGRPFPWRHLSFVDIAIDLGPEFLQNTRHIPSMKTYCRNFDDLNIKIWKMFDLRIRSGKISCFSAVVLICHALNSFVWYFPRVLRNVFRLAS